jgi:cyclophilin family peptidyl-prolyl cis-trans isomerase
MKFCMKTTLGEIHIELDATNAPVSAANFASYVTKGFYNGTIFHRCIPNFMIQGGGFTPDMKQKATDGQIKNEWRNGLKNKRGTLAMARLGGSPDSATCQFFINVKDNSFLDAPQPDGAAYAVFGKVTSGMEVVDAIVGSKTATKNGHGDVPVTPIVIESIAAV